MSSWTWAVLVAGLILAGWFAWRRKASGKSQNAPAAAATVPLTLQPAQREPDTLYQKGRIVARVSGTRVDEAGKKIFFEEVYHSDTLLLPDECDFQQYVILIRKIQHATKLDPKALHRGRVLGGVEADILSYRQQ